MRYHFYNSFNLGAGYSHADYINGKPVQPQQDLPHELAVDYMNGGCIIALRSYDGIAYLLVKKILYTNSNKTHTQQGRTVNINFSIETTEDKLTELSMICKGIIAEWKNFCRRLGDIIVIPASDKNEYNYSIDPIELDGLFSYMKHIGQCANLTPKLDFALNRPKKGTAILLVPLGNEEYYAKNAESLRLPSEHKKSSVHWTCVLPASKNEKEPGLFEKLTRKLHTLDYETFVNELSRLVVSTKKTPQTVDDKNRGVGDKTRVVGEKTRVVDDKTRGVDKKTSISEEETSLTKTNNKVERSTTPFEHANLKTNENKKRESKLPVIGDSASTTESISTVPFWTHPTVIKLLCAILGFAVGLAAGYALCYMLYFNGLVHK